MGSRRAFIGSLAAAGAFISVGGPGSSDPGNVSAQAPSPHRIDIHQHFISPSFNQGSFYDTAGSANPVNMAALKTLVPGVADRVRDRCGVLDQAPQVAGLQRAGFSTAELRGVERDNALAILPARRG